MRCEPIARRSVAERDIHRTTNADEFALLRGVAALGFRAAPLLLVLLTLLFLPCTARAQGLELNGGWTYVTGDFGNSGFNLGTAWWFTKRVTVAADYESGWNSSTIGLFAFTQIGATAVHNHLQSFVVGPRIFFSTHWTDEHKLNPFGEAEFGLSHLSQSVEQVGVPTVSASETDFTWLAGGGAEYLVAPHWSVRGNLDLMRTHFANAGQNRLRLILGVTYTFGKRGEGRN